MSLLRSTSGQLQWGHEYLLVVIVYEELNQETAIKLQWGHEYLLVVMCLMGHNVSLADLASMGPRVLARGDMVSHELDSLAVTSLQWGHEYLLVVINRPC